MLSVFARLATLCDFWLSQRKGNRRREKRGDIFGPDFQMVAPTLDFMSSLEDSCGTLWLSANL